uniref:hypothetical protein n=1 Tax=Vibrio parahaemolyticus TaxID=670 RepID=UPI001E46361C
AAAFVLRCSPLSRALYASEFGSMEEFKKLVEITELDEKHQLLSRVTGYVPDLKKTHEALSEVTLNDEVPEDLRG